MRKRKDELRDIYQGTNRDFEKDFTPQVAQEQIESQQRDLRRSQVVSIFFGTLIIVLSVALITVVIRDFLSERKPSRETPDQETSDIRRNPLPAEALWVMDSPRKNAPAESDEKPLSAERIKSAAYHTIMGQQALSINATEQALEHFQQVIDSYPDIKGLHLTLGMLHLKREEFTLTAKHLEKALQEEETFDTVASLGAACLGAEQYEPAEKYLKRAHELRPENPVCYKNLAVLYQKMKRDSDAIYNFEKYIDLQPNDLNATQTYALYLTKLGRWKDAAAFLTRLTQEVTDVAPVYFLLAQVQVQNGQQDKALEALKRGAQLVDPALALAWMNRKEFNALRGTGDFKALTDQLKTATKLP